MSQFCFFFFNTKNSLIIWYQLLSISAARRNRFDRWEHNGAVYYDVMLKRLETFEYQIVSMISDRFESLDVQNTRGISKKKNEAWGQISFIHPSIHPSSIHPSNLSFIHPFKIELCHVGSTSTYSPNFLVDNHN